MNVEALEVSRRAYDLLVRLAGGSTPRVRAWTGEEWGPSDAPGTIVLRHPGALRALLLPPSDLTAGEAYVFDDVDIEGDILSIVEFGQALAAAPLRSPRLRLLRLLRKLPDEARRAAAERPRMKGILHSRRRDRAAVTYHYDTGNDFFAQFLDPLMVYSCGYFLSPSESLDEAQRRKLDVVCRKLRLSPGDRLLDVGCGWGALVAYAAAEYGVTSVGVTLSGEQAHHAERRAKELDVENRVTILQRDYREVNGTFDAIASVGMFEHVGKKELAAYFARLRKLLEPGGLALNHGIVTRGGHRRRSRPTFINTYVFPDAELEPVDEVIGEAESAGFELRDAESLRAHYALTLRSWISNLEAHREAAVAARSERSYRIWRLYMAGSAVAFEQGAISVYQLLFADPARPWTFGRRSLLASDDL
jgi:cyclopropane-fatty-acyl-phospholipid synthase